MIFVSGHWLSTLLRCYFILKRLYNIIKSIMKHPEQIWHHLFRHREEKKHSYNAVFCNCLTKMHAYIWAHWKKKLHLILFRSSHKMQHIIGNSCGYGVLQSFFVASQQGSTFSWKSYRLREATYIGLTHYDKSFPQTNLNKAKTTAWIWLCKYITRI